MTTAKIVRCAITPSGVATAPAGTVLVAADNTVLVRTTNDVCVNHEPYWFDQCPGCDDWAVLSPPPFGQVRYYATDQLFASFEDRDLARVACFDPPGVAPYDPDRARTPLVSPFSIFPPPPPEGVVA